MISVPKPPRDTSREAGSSKGLQESYIGHQGRLGILCWSSQTEVPAQVSDSRLIHLEAASHIMTVCIALPFLILRFPNPTTVPHCG